LILYANIICCSEIFFLFQFLTSSSVKLMHLSTEMCSSCGRKNLLNFRSFQILEFQIWGSHTVLTMHLTNTNKQIFYNILDVIRNQVNLTTEYIWFILYIFLTCGILWHEVLSCLSVPAKKNKYSNHIWQNVQALRTQLKYQCKSIAHTFSHTLHRSQCSIIPK
jgi:hypothetical protein